MFGIDREWIKDRKDRYQEGDRVVLIHMSDPFSVMPSGTEGTVRCVDDIGTVHVDWDNGSSLGLTSEDSFRRAGE